MSGVHGIKETMELVDAVEKLTLDAMDALKDGVDLTDLNVLFANLTPLQTALEGIDKIDDEMGELDIEEIKQLVSRATGLVFNIISKVKEMKTVKAETEVTA